MYASRVSGDTTLFAVFFAKKHRAHKNRPGATDVPANLQSAVLAFVDLEATHMSDMATPCACHGCERLINRENMRATLGLEHQTVTK